ncbi:MAG: flagellar hook-associated protein FlgL [Pseudomonadota bacterium]
MRISTSTLYDVNAANLNQQQTLMFQTQQQIATGRRMLTPADDPAAAARALEVSQVDASNTQYINNLSAASSTLSLSDSTLQSVVTLLQNAHTKAINAVNPTLSNADRAALATDLQSSLDELVGLANSTDSNGNYLYSGFQGGITPFGQTAAGIQYLGDDGQRKVQGNASIQLSTSDSGADIFMRIKNGNGTFVTQTGASNSGSGIITQGVVNNPALLNSDQYQLKFNVSGGITTYDITDTTTGTALSAGNAYVNGQQITFNGMQFNIQGAPSDGDVFTIAPSTNVSIFQTLSNLISALRTPLIQGNIASTTQLNAALGAAQNGLMQGLDNVLTTRAALGSRMNTADSLTSTANSLGLQYKQTLSQLQEVDYNAAISELAKQSTTLQAAQKSFLQVQNLSIFNYL